MLKTYLADLHIHTVLSPCAEVEMIPPLIVSEALERGIHLIAITDHNATANIAAVIQAALDTELTVLPGMEVQTREEVHSLCLFDTLEQAQAWQATVSAHLPPIANEPDHFGSQFVVDATGDFIRSEEQLLITSVDLSFEEACQNVQSLGGLFIPAHVNRQAFGLIANLGFVPVDAPVDALEFSKHIRIDQALKKYEQASHYPLIQDGDAHRLDEFLGVNEFVLQEPTIAEIRLALHQMAGRSLRIRAIPN